jgi:hypothetical protein
MTQWQDKLNIIRWRSMEEADSAGSLFTSAARREASRAVMDEPDFLTARARWLSTHTSGGVQTAAESLQVPSLPNWIAWAIFLVALIVGYVLTEIGEAGRMNLLALPLVGLLVWNALAILFSLISEFTASSTSPGWLTHLLRWKQDNTQRIFRTHISPLLTARASAAGRIWLHLGAAAIALGSIIGLYAKGWSTEYRAVWESTLLDATQVQTFFSTVFSPASAVFGLPLPLSDLPLMQHSAGTPALPWIHLYSATLFLFIVLPRLALSAFAWWRGKTREDTAWHLMDWDNYQRKLKRGASTTSEHVWIITHGWRTQDEQRDRWSTTIEQALGGTIQSEYAAIPPGEEDDFIHSWSAQEGTHVIVFNAAATPEAEVQGRLITDFKNKVPSGHLHVLLDTQSLHERRTGSIDSRLQLWKTILGTPLILCGETSAS